MRHQLEGRRKLARRLQEQQVHESEAKMAVRLLVAQVALRNWAIRTRVDGWELELGWMQACNLPVISP